MSSQSNVAFTPSATSVADSSDNEFEPTPIHSPGGPQYEDLPPSYDEAQDQAVHDERNGIAPVDPSQIEAHRITANEGPNEPEVWEYRVRGEEVDPASEREQAPDYANHTSDKATSVPVQHVSNSGNIAVGRVQSGPASPSSKKPDLASAMLTQALEFTRQEPDAAAQYAPHLNRIIAVPEQGGPGRPANEHVTFLCAYAEVLNRHSIRPAEFADFLYGLQVLCTAANTTAEDLLHGPTYGDGSPAIVHDYIRGANEAFFAPRGLVLSFRSETALLDMLPIPSGHKATVLTNLADKTATPEWRAQQLYPWIEALDVDDVPMPSERVLKLHEMSERFSGQTAAQNSLHRSGNNSSQNSGLPSAEPYEDPPHSIPSPPEGSPHAHGTRGRGAHHPQGRRGGHCSSSGTPGHGPFGARGGGPFGAPGNGPFGRCGQGPFGAPGNGPFGRRGCSSRGGRGEWRGNEWAEVGKELGKIGEEFGKRMNDWGVDFGKRANAFGLEVGKRASGSGAGSQQRDPASGPAYQEVHDDLPPAYDPLAGQDSGVLYGDGKVDPETRTSTSTSTTTDKGKAKAKELNKDNDDDDDTSSLSSDSSISDTDSDDDNDDDHFPDTDKDLNLARKLSIRDARRQLKQRNRELKKQHRAKKRELKAKHAGKGKGKAKKSTEWKDLKKEYKAQRKELRKEKLAARKEWREARDEARREMRCARGGAKGRGKGKGGVQSEGGEKQVVWLVVENLAP